MLISKDRSTGALVIPRRVRSGQRWRGLISAGLPSHTSTHSGMRATLLLLTLAAHPLGAQIPDRPLVITGVTVIAMAGPPAPLPQTVVIEHGRITAIYRAAVPVPPAGALIIDGRGKYLIPGLWDMHTHLALRPLLPGASGTAGLQRNREWAFPLLLASGVTGVRDMAGTLSVLVGWRNQIVAGTLLGPRLVVTGRKIGKDPVVAGAPFPVASDEDVRRSVALLQAGGADFVKVDGLPGARFPALFSAARAAHLPVVGHTALDLGAAGVAEAGQRSIEHLDGVLLATSAHEPEIRRDALAEAGWWRRLLTWAGRSNPEENFRRRYREVIASQSPARTDSLISTFLAHQTWQVPTLTMLRDIRLLDPTPAQVEALSRYGLAARREPGPDLRWDGDTLLAHQVYRREVEIFARMVQRGVPILAGTDGPGGNRVPGASIGDELEFMVDAGMTPEQALASATREPARFLGLLDSLGTVEQGKLADLVLLDADPRVRIGNVRRVYGVIRAGRWLPPEALDSLRTAAAGLVGR